MHAQFTTRDVYPHRDAGVALLIIGILMVVAAVIVGSICTPFSGGPGPAFSTFCPFSGVAFVLGVLGFLLVILGVVLMVVRGPAHGPGPYAAPGWGYSAPVPPPTPFPPAAPSWIACKNCGRVYGLNQHPFCPNCGSKLGG